MSYSAAERRRATAWKSAPQALPHAARHAAPYRAGVPTYGFCLPSEHAHHNLLPEVTEEALALFGELGIPWHAGVAGGLSNHLWQRMMRRTETFVPLDSALFLDPQITSPEYVHRYGAAA